MVKKKNVKENQLNLDDFVIQYQREYDFYDAVSRITAQLIESKLTSRGIRAIVTSRAKNSSRLLEKLRNRMNKENKHYETSEDIYNDIVDLAGVRIALYFNSELDEVHQIIHEVLNVHGEKNFPDNNKSLGYKAKHYRGKLREDVVTEQQIRYTKANIEVQVASLLMHAWAEVEHDIVYKPMQGDVSSEEKSFLDQLNENALLGEDILRKLQEAASGRNRFNTHYDLSTYLFKYAKENFGLEKSQLIIGDVKKLFDFLISTKVDTQKKLSNRLKLINIENDNRSVAEQITDAVIGSERQNYTKYLKLSDERKVIDSSRNIAIGKFIVTWINLENKLKELTYYENQSRHTPLRLQTLCEKQLIERPLYDKIYKLRSIRNNLVHGIETPDVEYLDIATEEINTVIRELQDAKAAVNRKD